MLPKSYKNSIVFKLKTTRYYMRYFTLQGDTAVFILKITCLTCKLMLRT